MDSPNAGLLFNKNSFLKLHQGGAGNNNHIKSVNKRLYSLSLDTNASKLFDIKEQGVANVVQFKLTTTWPGLVLGMGYGHSTGKSKDEFKVGFYFDFTTGLPVIPGSYVKGKLRSFFPGRYKGAAHQAKKQAVFVRLISIFKKLGIFPSGITNGSSSADWENAFKKLEDGIFEGKDEKGNKINLANQDKFLEAFICNGVNGSIVYGNQPIEKENIYLGEDTITVHKHPLKNPLPLRMLKILPGVEFCFQFIFHCEGGLSVDDKQKLFTFLLQQYGIGAKTSNGFGKFKEQFKYLEPDKDNDNDAGGYINFTKFDQLKREETADDEAGNDETDAGAYNYRPKIKHQKQTHRPLSVKIQESDDWVEVDKVKSGSIVNATVIDYANGSATIRLHIKGVEINQKIYRKATISEAIVVTIANTTGKVEKGNFGVEIRK